MAGGGKPRERYGVVRIAAGAYPSAAEFDFIRGDIELRGRHSGELGFDFSRGQLGCAAGRGGKAAGIVARRDRPSIARGVEFRNDADFRRLEAQLVGYDLRQYRAMALTLGN